ncbi:unnamed protein product [Effrenium voratum]|nr:unnamed protein product [Effrenium voratum]
MLADDADDDRESLGVQRSRSLKRSRAKRETKKNVAEEPLQIDMEDMDGRIREVFEMFDKDGSGQLDMHELRDVLNSLNPRFTSTEVAFYCKWLNESGNNDGLISHKEFMDWLEAGSTAAQDLGRLIIAETGNSIASRLRQIFRRFDKDASGTLDMEEMAGVFRVLSPDFTIQDIAQLLKELDTGGDKRVSRSEFMAWLQKGLGHAPQVKKAILANTGIRWEQRIRIRKRTKDSRVLLACLCILLAQGFMKDHLEIFQEYGGLIGTSISGTFLTIIGLLNLYTARQLWRAWKGDESCGHSHEILGVVTRCCPRLFEGIREPWHMLPVGFLFGLGFDTSSEVGLLGIVAVSHGLAQPAAVLLLPLLFMSGMCLLDTLNGFLMAWVYSTSLEDERPKLYFNLFLTSSSGLIALLIGCLELLSLCPRLWQLDGGFWALLQKANDNFELLGVVVISIFLVSLLLALACFRRVFRRRSDGAEALLRENVVRYVQSGDFIDRSGV